MLGVNLYLYHIINIFIIGCYECGNIFQLSVDYTLKKLREVDKYLQIQI